MYMSMNNNAPEKIYVHVRANKELGTTWHGKKITNSDIEYVRTDAFIEKALEFFENDLCCYIGAQDFTIDHKRLNMDFKKAMKL